MYRQRAISKNNKFQTIGFRLNQFTLSNNRYVPLWQGNQVCAEAQKKRVSLESPDLKTIEQLLGELWGRIRDLSVQPSNLRQLQVALH